MRVLCIDGVKPGERSITGIPVKQNELIVEGEIYDVVGDGVWCGMPYYVLSIVPYPTVYRQSRFIPCSEIDENELVNEKELTSVN